MRVVIFNWFWLVAWVGAGAQTNLFVELLRVSEEGGQDFHDLYCRGYGQAVVENENVGNCRLYFTVQLEEMKIETTRYVYTSSRDYSDTWSANNNASVALLW